MLRSYVPHLALIVVIKSIAPGNRLYLAIIRLSYVCNDGKQALKITPYLAVANPCWILSTSFSDTIMIFSLFHLIASYSISPISWRFSGHYASHMIQILSLLNC